MDETLMEIVRWITRGIEVTGIAVIVIGAVIALIAFLRPGRSQTRDERMGCLRSDLGRAILLGLEFLVAADIINTVAIEPSLESVAILGGIVLIRTFLSFSLEVEIEGRWPSERHKGEREGGVAASRIDPA